MDYRKIYNDFIESRRANPPGEAEYSEKHHVIPRCLGGSNKAKNLIPLIPEDHFFAHLLLAKAYDTFNLWNAARWMAMNIESHYLYLTKTRIGYGIAKRRWAEMNRGINHPRADLTIYAFYHIDGDVFKGTRIDFEAAKDIDHTSVNQMILGKANHCFGWSIKPITRVEVEEAQRERASKSGKKLKGFIRDKKKYKFFNRDLQIIIDATQSEMKEMGYLNRTNVSALVSGSRILSKGWILYENKEFAYEKGLQLGINASRYNPKKYNFINMITKEKRVATISEMGESYSKGRRNFFGNLISGNLRGLYGWCLEGEMSLKVRIMNRKYKMKNNNGQIISGTQQELCEHIGVTKMAVNNVLLGKAVHTKGWSLYG